MKNISTYPEGIDLTIFAYDKRSQLEKIDFFPQFSGLSKTLYFNRGSSSGSPKLEPTKMVNLYPPKELTVSAILFLSDEWYEVGSESSNV